MLLRLLGQLLMSCWTKLGPVYWQWHSIDLRTGIQSCMVKRRPGCFSQSIAQWYYRLPIQSRNWRFSRSNLLLWRFQSIVVFRLRVLVRQSRGVTEWHRQYSMMLFWLPLYSVRNVSASSRKSSGTHQIQKNNHSKRTHSCILILCQHFFHYIAINIQWRHRN